MKKQVQNCFLRPLVSFLLVLIATLDFAVPCCSGENSLPVAKHATLSGVSARQSLIDISPEKTPASQGSHICDNCYCCSTFTAAVFPLVEPALTTVERDVVLRPQEPPSTSQRTPYRPPRA